MNKVIYVRSPEADFRPEKHISNVIIDAMRKQRIPVHEVVSGGDFQNLNSQSLFYDDETMTRSFANGVIQVTDAIESGDYVFFADAWNPMLPALRFHLHCAGVSNFRIGGIFHSSAGTPGDFLESQSWAMELEAYILKHCLDDVFVATEYLANILKTSHGTKNLSNGEVRLADDFAHIHVTGLPLAPCPLDPDKEYPTDCPQRRVVFAHRWAPDKQPNHFINVAAEYRQGVDEDDYTPAEFVVLHPLPIEGLGRVLAENVGVKFIHCTSREMYWREMSKADAVISTAQLETFGYAIMDGVMLGAIPFVPRTACYPFMYRDDYIYDPSIKFHEIALQLATLLRKQRATRSGDSCLNVLRQDYVDTLVNCPGNILSVMEGHLSV